MPGTLKVIHLEDVRSDADIVRREMQKIDYTLDWTWAPNKATYEEALDTVVPDIVLSDHSLPAYSSVEAFRALKQRGMDVPFILITSTVSEEFAVMMMREGIADYLLKDRLQRLPVAVVNALERWQSERQRRHYMEEILRNERRFRGLIENNQDLIIVTDAAFAPAYVSQSYTRLLGWTIEDRRVAGYTGFIHPDDKLYYQSTLHESLSNPGKYHSLLYRVRKRDGEYLWVEGTVINLLDDESINGVIFNLRDITERREAEESLKTSQANLAAIMNSTDISIYSLDREFRYITFNDTLKQTLKRIYGLDVKVGDVIYDFLNKLDPAEAEGWRQVYTKAIQGETINFEKEFKIGDYHSINSLQINPIRNGDNVIGLACLAWDVTEAKMASRQIEQNQARFRSLIENNYDAILVRDEELRLVYHSPSIRRLLGYSDDELINAKATLVATEDQPLYHEFVKEAKESPGRPISCVLRVTHKDGHLLWTEGVITNMLNDENVRGLVFNFRDITERREAEVENSQVTADLIERNKNLEQYAYIVSHNLRGPVANILGLANLLEYAELAPEDKQLSMDHLFSSVRKLDEVIRDLNMILQMQKGIVEKKEDIALQDLVDDIITSIKDLVTGYRVKMNTDFRQVPHVKSLKSYLHSIFYNLISNSIKYCHPDRRPEISITSRRTEHGIALNFVDNGLGIDLHTQGSKVFGLYKRFHGNHIEGKGMGLFMTRTQVEALGGKISVMSEVDRGSEFIVELPQ